VSKSIHNIKIIDIVYLEDISILQFSGPVCRNLKMFNRLCGDAVLAKFALYTNRWGRVTPWDGEEQETTLQTLRWKTVAKVSQVELFMGNHESAWAIVSVTLEQASQRRDEL